MSKENAKKQEFTNIIPIENLRGRKANSNTEKHYPISLTAGEIRYLYFMQDYVRGKYGLKDQVEDYARGLLVKSANAFENLPECEQRIIRMT